MKHKGACVCPKQPKVAHAKKMKTAHVQIMCMFQGTELIHFFNFYNQGSTIS